MEIHEFSDYLKLQNSFGPRTGAGMPTRLVAAFFPQQKEVIEVIIELQKKHLGQLKPTEAMVQWFTKNLGHSLSPVYRSAILRSTPVQKKNMQPVTGHRHINKLVHILDLWNMDL